MTLYQYAIVSEMKEFYDNKSNDANKTLLDP